jgi:D-alanyl-D-alanine carboxypeptidase (penicillin-binding protein 5/6)
VKSSSRTGLRSGILAAVGLGSVLLGFLIAVTPAIADLTTTTSSTDVTTTTSVGATSTTSTTTTEPTTATTVPRALALPWPSQASAALAVPQLSVVAASPGQVRKPIASLTKMMTTWVVLQDLPLTFGEKGRCLVVNANDVAMYNYDVATDQSSAKIALNEKLCEGTLLRGMLVHSAGDYAQLLLSLMGVSESRFVATMNTDAKALGLTRTHYVDFTGISPGDTSTAQDQTTLAVDLMTSESIVRQIVVLGEVKLPVAGVVVSYTPFEGQYGVVGVKSGYTNPAGGCDVMAVNVPINNTVITLYIAVLGVHGGDAIDRAGEDALVLAQSLKSKIKVEANSTGRTVMWTGWPGYSTATTTTSTTSTTTTTTTVATSTSTSTSTTTTTTGP